MRRLWITPVLFGLSALIAGAGCQNVNPVLLIAYLFNDGEPKIPAKFPLKPRPKHEKEEVRVIVLTSCVPSVAAEMAGVDRALAAEFIRLLQERCTENKEKVTVKKAPIIDTFKKDNPDWRNLSPYDIGKKFDADYIIDIEVLEMSLFEPGTRQELMRGRAQVALAVYDLSKPSKDKDPVYSLPESPFLYPRGHEVLRHDESVTGFKQKFIRRIAGELVLPFTAHTSDQKVMVD